MSHHAQALPTWRPRKPREISVSVNRTEEDSTSDTFPCAFGKVTNVSGERSALRTSEQFNKRHSETFPMT
jgi:hypothetical protein